MGREFDAKEKGAVLGESRNAAMALGKAQGTMLQGMSNLTPEDVTSLVDKYRQGLEQAVGVKGGASAPAADKGGKKDNKKKADAKPAAEAKPEPTPEEKRKMQLKKVIKEGGKRGVEIEGAADMGGLQFFCTGVEEPDGDLDMMVESMTAMNAQSDPTEEERKGGSGKIGKMIFSAGLEQLAICAYVPEDKQKELSCEDWIANVCKEIGGTVGTKGKSVSTAFVKQDSDKGIFPLKVKDQGIMAAINFLKTKGLFPDKDDDSDDDFVFGDDDFPS